MVHIHSLEAKLLLYYNPAEAGFFRKRQEE